MNRPAIRSKDLAIMALTLACWLGCRPDPAWALSWNFIGPEPITGAQANYGGDLVGPIFDAAGRVTAIAPDPSTQGRIFVGTANGGLWMIAGANGSNPSYARISDTLPNPTQAIGAIALDPSTSPPTIYVGTGEGNYCGDCSYGRGLFFSTDLGSTWSEITPSNFEEQNFTKLTLVKSSGGSLYLLAGVNLGESYNRSDVQFPQSKAARNGLWQITLGTTPTAIQFNINTSQFSQLGSCVVDKNNDPCPIDDILVLPTATGADIFVAVDGLFATSGAPGIYMSSDSAIAGRRFSPPPRR